MSGFTDVAYLTDLTLVFHLLFTTNTLSIVKPCDILYLYSDTNTYSTVTVVSVCLFM